MKTPAWLSQTHAPFLWEVFQLLLGSHKDKTSLYRSLAQGRTTVLEIGCSTGITASAFQKLPGIRYTGIDIDSSVIGYAKKKFRKRPNFDFVCEDLRSFTERKHGYDLVLFAGILHHVDDALGIELLRASTSLVDGQGTLAVIEPLFDARDRGFNRLWLKYLEKGEHVRTNDQMKELFDRAGLHVRSERQVMMGQTSLPLPKDARFGVYELANP